MHIREYRPNILFVDGAYMVKPGGNSSRMANWEKAMTVMEELKQIAMNEEDPGGGLPTSLAGEVTRKDLRGIAYTDAVGQISSVVLGLTNEADETSFDHVQYKQLELLKGREGERGKIRIRCDMQRSSIE